jgi:hypothetical protein
MAMVIDKEKGEYVAYVCCLSDVFKNVVTQSEMALLHMWQRRLFSDSRRARDVQWHG